MLKILQASLQQFMNQEIPDVQAGFGSQRNQISNCQHVLDHRKSKRVPLKTSTSASLTKVFDGVDHNKLKKIPKEIGIPDYLICLLKGFTNLYESQETTVRNRHGTMNWFQTRKGVHQGCILSPCFFKLNAEYIMRNARLDESQAGIKTAGRNINNLRYAHNTTLMAESEEELKSLLMKKASEKADLKLNVQNSKIMASSPITLWQIVGETMAK